MWDRFWKWYSRHTTESLLLTAVIVYIQIPHMVWNADLMLEAGIVSRQNFFLDFFFYGIDLIEVIPMINLGMLIYSNIRKKNNARHTN